MARLALSSALLRVIGGLLRRTWVVTLVAIVACGAFAARAVAAWHAADEPVVIEAPPRAAPVAPASPRLAVRAEVLVERNIFCSACTPEPGPGPAYSGQPAILIATSVGRASRATVRVIPTEAQGSWGEGESIPGVGRITRIGHASIEVVDAGGHTHELSLRDAPLPSAPASGAATPGAAADPLAQRVKRLADGSYEVERDVVRELVESAGKNAGVRAVPVLEDGKVRGLRFASVRKTSVAAAIGIQSGDILAAIDGERLETAQQLLDLYGKLDRLSRLELQGTRRGKPLAIQLQLR